jgi:hypothetical protein
MAMLQRLVGLHAATSIAAIGFLDGAVATGERAARDLLSRI